MRRTLASALAASLVALGAAGQAAAQDMAPVRTAPLFDIGVSAGGAWSSSWFTVGDNGYSPGFAPIFGGEATFWLSPTFGLRANGQYMPSTLPKNSDGFDTDDYVQNNWFYGLDLMWRPLFWSNPGWLGSMYVFLGGGGLTTNVAGQLTCVPVTVWLANGVCLPETPTRATVGQGEAGLGFDLFPLGPLGLFLEAGVHGYDSPAHVAENAQNAEDKFAFTPYAVLGLKLGFGNIIPPPPPPPPPPAVIPPPPPAEIPPPPPPVQQMQDISVCVLQNGQLSSVTAQYNPATGDTTGVPTVTEGYAANATWFINNEPITINNRRYVKYGLPRVLGVTEVTSSTTYQGVPVFVEAGATGTPDVIYVPVRTGCEFQPYQVEQKAGAVRG